MTGARALRLWFVSSVWLFVALNAAAAVRQLMQPDRILGQFPGGYDVRVLIAPLALLVFELFLWFRMFRDSRAPARLFAGLVGAYIWLMVIFVNLMIGDLFDRKVSTAGMLLYAFSGAGHLAYAFAGNEHGH